MILLLCFLTKGDGYVYYITLCVRSGVPSSLIGYFERPRKFKIYVVLLRETTEFN